MPNVVVYVPSAAWKKLKEKGLDPAAVVREWAKKGYEVTDEPVPELAEREQPATSARTAKSQAGMATGPVTPQPGSRSASSDDEEHFKPFFKASPERKKKRA